jgi:transcriptional regulator with XRE-family HTH domain
MGSIVDTKEVGARIRTYRQQAGLSQEQLAELVGVSFQQIQKYESGFTTLSITKLQQISSALKVSVADFFGTEPSMGEVILTAEERELLQAYRQVKNSEMRSCILKLVGNLNKRVK